MSSQVLRENASAASGHAAVGDRFDWLDGMRGIAIIGVFLVHAAQTAGPEDWPTAIFQYGQYGVQLFFAISALTCILTLQRGPRIGEWYIRRITRIAIVYYMGIIIYFPLFYIQAKLGFKDESFMDPINILANIFFLHGWVPSANNNVVPGGWSIAVEVTFYLIAPWVVLILRTPRLAFAVLTLLSITMIVSNEVFFGPVQNNRFLYFWPVNQLPVLFLVVAAYALCLATGRNIWIDNTTLPIVTIGGALLVISGGFFGVFSDISNAVAPSLIGLGMFSIMAGWGHWRRVVTARWLVFIGKISFSLYIIHFAFVDVVRYIVKRVMPEETIDFWLTWPLAAAVMFLFSVLAATFLRKYVEEQYRPLADWLVSKIYARESLPV